MRQGDPSDSVYILLYGRLQALSESENGPPQVVGEIQRGETVGEWGLLSGRPRTATVVAVRDSYLARIDRDKFERLAETRFRILTYATRDVIGRLRQSFSARWLGPAVTTFALVPVGPDAPMAESARGLAAELVELGPTLYLNRERLGDILGNEAARALESDSTDSRLIAWLNEVELRHRFVLYEGDDEPNGWTRRCLRQADRVLIVGRAGSPPPTGQPSALQADRDVSDRRELILVHDRRQPIVSGTRAWLTARDVDAHHHVMLTGPDDLRRLTRRLAGRAIGLVLGGGGLRSAAHIGVVRALRESGIPVDYVGGTSAGSLMAAQFACGWGHEQMLNENRQLLVLDNALGEYTVPFVSLVTAGHLGKGLQAMFGDTRIEDLWMPFLPSPAISRRLSSKFTAMG